MSPFFAATGVAWKARCEHTSTRNVRIARAMDSPCCSPLCRAGCGSSSQTRPQRFCKAGARNRSYPASCPPWDTLSTPSPPASPAPRPPPPPPAPPLRALGAPPNGQTLVRLRDRTAGALGPPLRQALGWQLGSVPGRPPSGRRESPRASSSRLPKRRYQAGLLSMHRSRCFIRTIDAMRHAESAAWRA